MIGFQVVQSINKGFLKTQTKWYYIKTRKFLFYLLQGGGVIMQVLSSLYTIMKLDEI